jgi:hypothetical protein
MSLEHLLTKIDRCIDYQTLYALEDDFNSCGLTIQTTGSNRMILCKLRAGKPIAKDVIDDYIFIGNADDANREPTERALSRILDFIRNNHGPADKIKKATRTWRNGLKMYEASIPIMNEDIAYITGELDEDIDDLRGRTIND